MICFQISIFAESYTPVLAQVHAQCMLWFAFKLVSLQSHIHRQTHFCHPISVVICFQISIFAESYTPLHIRQHLAILLWFAFKLVSLQSHIHRALRQSQLTCVVICFQISIFAESYTPGREWWSARKRLWFAFKLVSLQSHIHQAACPVCAGCVVICFQISIFAESYTP